MQKINERRKANDAFSKNVDVKDRFVYWEARCRKGLWAVTALTKDRCIAEAQHYFLQYYYDGEYDI